MSETSLAILFDPSASHDNPSERRFVHLEQVRSVYDPNKTVTMADIKQMIARAKSGIAASTYGYEDCPMTINDQTYTMWFDFYAWPSSMELNFTLDSTMCCVSDPQTITPLTEFSVIFDDTDTVELDFILTELVGLPYWETICCYRVDGTPVYGVTIELEGNSTLVASEKVFGVARVRGYKMGAQHRLTTTLVPYIPTADAYTIITSGFTASFDTVYYMPIIGTSLRPQIWTLEFINQEVFNVTGNTVGYLASGNITDGFSCKYFTVSPSMFSQTYESGDYIRFKIYPSEEAGTNWGYTDIVTWIDNDGVEWEAPESNVNMTGAKISNLNVTVTARWLDSNGDEQTESLKMEVAQCVKDALDLCDGEGGPIIDPVPGEDFYVGYFSICDGDVIEVRKIKDKDD